MPKFGCQCGHVIDLSPIPSGVVGRLIRLYDDERIYDPIELQMTDLIDAASRGDKWLASHPDRLIGVIPSKLLLALRRRREWLRVLPSRWRPGQSQASDEPGGTKRTRIPHNMRDLATG